MVLDAAVHASIVEFDKLNEVGYISDAHFRFNNISSMMQGNSTYGRRRIC